MKYQQIYSDIIEKLKKNERPLIKLAPELIALLKKEWEVALLSKTNEAQKNEAIKQILCILDNAQNTTAEFNDLFIKTLKEVKNEELLIYALAASQKHVIAESLKSGKMFSLEYFEILKKLLKEKNPELKEWTLRTIESMGPLSIRLKKEVLEAKPGLLKLFDKHQKASSQIIDYLEKEWSRFKL